ncbi:MAG: hypothetical protein HY051_05640 [Candidatus Aenigmarchaeota archaeon]|nr:hypothetical protein [Candidatus Aenigmarchaeota archaeon]
MNYDFTGRNKRHPSLYIIGVGILLLLFVLFSGKTEQPQQTTTTTTTITATTTVSATTMLPSTTTTTTSTTTSTIAGNQPPRVLSSVQRPNPVRTGKEVTFAVTVADAESEFVTVSVCKNEQCTGRYCIGQGSAKPDGAEITCTYVIPVTTSGAINYWAKAEEAGRSSEIAGSFVLNVTSL